MKASLHSQGVLQLEHDVTFSHLVPALLQGSWGYGWTHPLLCLGHTPCWCTHSLENESSGACEPSSMILNRMAQYYEMERSQLHGWSHVCRRNATAPPQGPMVSSWRHCLHPPWHQRLAGPLHIPHHKPKNWWIKQKKSYRYTLSQGGKDWYWKFSLSIETTRLNRLWDNPSINTCSCKL